MRRALARLEAEKQEKRNAKQAKRDAKRAKRDAKRDERDRIAEEEHEKRLEEIDTFIEESEKLRAEEDARLEQKRAAKRAKDEADGDFEFTDDTNPEAPADDSALPAPAPTDDGSVSPSEDKAD